MALLVVILFDDMAAACMYAVCIDKGVDTESYSTTNTTLLALGFSHSQPQIIH